jgi:hypothetical protein
MGGVDMTTKLKAANLNATYSADQILKTSAAGALSWGEASVSAGFDSVVSITSSQSYTIPADITKQVFYVTGGGGGGGGANAALGASGGSAGGTVIIMKSLAATTTMDIVIGAAQAGGSAGADGVIGVDTTVTRTGTDGTDFDTLTGPGGKPGRWGTAPIDSATPTGGTINLAGGGSRDESGSSYWGGGGVGAYTAITSKPGKAYGSGGGGGYPSSASYYPGAAGAIGIVVIYLYK